MTLEEFKEKFQPDIPNKPGVYHFLSANGDVLYVGKAKNLRKRVSSYFLKSKNNPYRLRLLVKKTDEFRFTVVETEHDAFLLENNLIKEHQPRYNIQLKDDKSFPFLCIKNERFPRVFLTRTVEDDGSVYLGPFTSVKRVKDLLNFIRNIYPLRTCNFNLSEENISKGKFRACLEYQIGNCLAPCIDKQEEESYNENIDAIKHILKGHFSPVIKELKTVLKTAVDDLDFEMAHKVKKRLELIEKFQSKSVIVNPKLDKIEVYSILQFDKIALVHFFYISRGTISMGRSYRFDMKLEESKEDILAHTILKVRESFNLDSPEILIPFEMDLPIEKVVLTVPVRGEKKKLLDLCHKNALIFKNKVVSNLEKFNAENRVDELMETMQKDLRMTTPPRHIECFDNSNFQGSNPVASMVLFRNGKPARKEYRQYHIKTVKGPDDFASMTEVVFRRYKRLIDEDKPLPDLIIIDGGKGQLSAALKSLDELKIRNKVAIISIAKKLEELYFPNDSIPVHLSKKSRTLQIIQQLRNEAHRFAINFHRKTRDKSTLKNPLLEVEGIGPATADKLLKHFKSYGKVFEADKSVLIGLVGKKKAEEILKHKQ